MRRSDRSRIEKGQRYGSSQVHHMAMLPPTTAPDQIPDQIPDEAQDQIPDQTQDQAGVVGMSADDSRDSIASRS